jgi:predicted ATPase
MSSIRIKNFGPIKSGFKGVDSNGRQTDFVDIRKVTVFIGNQGSGKSTVAKLISTFSWIEKALIRGDYDIKYFTSYNRFRKTFGAYHRIENYFLDENGKDKANIVYDGDAYLMIYAHGKLTIEATGGENYRLPQIMYVPAERNFIANVKTPKALKLTSDSLLEFVTEFDNAKNEIKGAFKLPINDTSAEYNKSNDIVYIKGNNYKIRLTEASSGFQSLVPLYLVSWFLANSVKKQTENAKEPMSSDELERFRKGVAEIWSNEALSDEQRRAALSVLSAKFTKNAFINIVEEPEQNLFPASQWQMLKALLEFNNMSDGNKLIMTTHSPYIINYLSIAIQGKELLEKIKKRSDGFELLKRLNEVVSADAVISIDDIAVYELDEVKGTISKLGNQEDILSDKNYLNNMLAEGNSRFDSLLEIEQEL